MELLDQPGTEFDPHYGEHSARQRVERFLADVFGNDPPSDIDGVPHSAERAVSGPVAAADSAAVADSTDIAVPRPATPDIELVVTPGFLPLSGHPGGLHAV